MNSLQYTRNSPRHSPRHSSRHRRKTVISPKRVALFLYAFCFIAIGQYLCFFGVHLGMSEIAGLQEEMISLPIQSRLAAFAGMSEATTTTTEKTPTSMIYQHTFGLFDGFSDERWNDVREAVQLNSWYADQEDPLKNHKNVFWWNKRNMIPNFRCPKLVKMPEHAAQGEAKYVCNPQNLVNNHKPKYPSVHSGTGTSSCLVYSIGSAGDYSFEDDLVRMHPSKDCEVHVFDPDIAYARNFDDQLLNIHYHPWGLVSSTETTKLNLYHAPQDGTSSDYLTFPQIQQKLGHENRTIDILKIDCEGCEWSTMKDWIGVGARQILIEVHGVPSPDGKKGDPWYQDPLNPVEWYDTFRENGYALFNKEPNMHCCLELAFFKLSDEFWRPVSRVKQQGLI